MSQTPKCSHCGYKLAWIQMCNLPQSLYFIFQPVHLSNGWQLKNIVYFSRAPWWFYGNWLTACKALYLEWDGVRTRLFGGSRFTWWLIIKDIGDYCSSLSYTLEAPTQLKVWKLWPTFWCGSISYNIEALTELKGRKLWQGYWLGLGIARYLTIQFDSFGLHSIRFRFNIDPIASISIQ